MQIPSCAGPGMALELLSSPGSSEPQPAQLPLPNPAGQHQEEGQPAPWGDKYAEVELEKTQGVLLWGFPTAQSWKASIIH